MPAWIVALIAVGSFGAGVFIAWDHLRPGYLQRKVLPELPEDPEPQAPAEEARSDGDS